MADVDDPISPEEAAMMALIIDLIEPDTDVTVDRLHAQLEALMEDPPSRHDVENALAILRMPHVRYQPGEPSDEVLGRMRDMLAEAETPPLDPTKFSRYFRY
ncbi:hypothetical protein [Nocardia sp. NPDC051833]|uniref:hypothetical protein n=1 Tax=Nocardia sp. NPDC051833 TaxID=3155674 RepID=UPI00341FB33A